MAFSPRQARDKRRQARGVELVEEEDRGVVGEADHGPMPGQPLVRPRWDEKTSWSFLLIVFFSGATDSDLSFSFHDSEKLRNTKTSG